MLANFPEPSLNLSLDVRPLLLSVFCPLLFQCTGLLLRRDLESGQRQNQRTHANYLQERQGFDQPERALRYQSGRRASDKALTSLASYVCEFDVHCDAWRVDTLILVRGPLSFCLDHSLFRILD
jgi:hypothetical protein